jgi:two-component sensor histidine kinase
MKDQEKLLTSVFEKEILIQEIHHRVKNNLQVISSLIGLQMMKARGKGSVAALSDVKNRIYTMSLLHQILYQEEDLSHIDMNHYVQDISIYLVQSLEADSSKLDIAVLINDVHLNLEKALPCGLIINEVVSNSIKYAFNEMKRGKITIKMIQQEKMILLNIEDNGIGLPENLDVTKSASLGLSLIYSFTDQLGGTIEINRDNGTEYRIVFPLEVKNNEE